MFNFIPCSNKDKQTVRMQRSLKFPIVKKLDFQLQNYKRGSQFPISLPVFPVGAMTSIDAIQQPDSCMAHFVYQCVSYPLTRVTHLRGEFDPSCPIFRVGSVLFVCTKASSAQQTLVPDQKHVRRELRKESCCITWCQPIFQIKCSCFKNSGLEFSFNLPAKWSLFLPVTLRLCRYSMFCLGQSV